MLNVRRAVVALALCAAAGCAGKINHEVLGKVKKVGLLTVTLDRVGQTPADAEVMQQVADFAAAEYARVLAHNKAWEFVPPSQYANDPDFKNLARPTQPGIIRAELDRMAAAGELKPADPAAIMEFMKAQLSGDEETKARLMKESVGSNAAMFEQILAEHSAPYVAPRGYPTIPYTVLKPEGGTTTYSVQGGNAAEKDPKETMRDMLFTATGKLADKLGLDALAIVYLRTEVKATVGGIGVITGERGLDSIKMVPTLIMVAKTGERAIDMGYPVLDDLATSNMGVPVYKIAYSDKGTHTHPSTNRKFDYVIDLKDPEGKVLVEYKDLVTEAADEFMADIESAMASK